MSDIDNCLTRGVEQILPSKDALSKLMEEKKITLYQGYDPSMPSLHLGNFVGLMKLRQFQKLGHNVIFLVGDFTGMIGDPDKISTRKPLTHEQVRKNAEKWKKQASKVLDFSGNNPAKILFNSDWNFKLTFEDLIGVTSHLTVGQIIERDMFQERLKKHKPIYLHEFLYPVAQGYDSVHLGVDLEIGGSDQIFNMLVGRTLVKGIKDKEKFVLATKLLVDKEGKKAGKTTQNATFMDSSAEDIYASIMAFSDDLIFMGFELLTEIDLSGLEAKIKDNPMGQKKVLAYEVTKLIHSEEDAQKAQEHFESTFQNRQFSPSPSPSPAAESLVGTVAKISEVGSKSKAKRLIIDGAVDVNGKTIKDLGCPISKGDEIKVGKKIFVKVNG